MKLYNIEKPDMLFTKLDGFKGGVSIVLPDGNQCDWATDGELIKSLWKTMPDKRLDNMEVKLDNNEDAVDMIDFLMRGNCA